MPIPSYDSYRQSLIEGQRMKAEYDRGRQLSARRVQDTIARMRSLNGGAHHADAHLASLQQCFSGWQP